MNIANKPFRPAIPCSPAALRAPSSPYAAHTKAQFGNSRHFQCSTYAKTTHSLPLPLVSFQNVLFFFFSSFFSPFSLLLQPVPRRDGRVGLGHGRSLQKRAKSQRPGFPLPDGKQNGHGAAILFAAGWEGEGKGGETQARREG